MTSHLRTSVVILLADRDLAEGWAEALGRSFDVLVVASLDEMRAEGFPEPGICIIDIDLLNGLIPEDKRGDGTDFAFWIEQAKALMAG